MKIFNWVHRRFSNTKAENAKKNGVIAADDKQFLVENTCCNALERWRGGILTIGTFGYDPLKDESEQINDISNYWYEEEDEEFEKEQLVSAECQSHDEISDSGDESENGDDDDEEEENPLVLAAYAEDYEGGLMEMEGCRREDFGFEYVMMEKKARTTLADLFYADSEDTKKQPLKKGEMMKEKSGCKHGFSFGKKLMLDDARPIHKLHQLMRRMLKRKIHPDIGPVSSKVSAVKKCEMKDDASLLLTQDATI